MAGEIKGNVRSFMMAGKAVFTVENPTTGNRFTYKVVRKSIPGGALHFVKVLTGPDNTADYEFLGTVFADINAGELGYVHSSKSRISREAPSAKAFTWLWKRMVRGGDPSPARVLHEGCCGRCGRALTVPESIESGIGPECARKMEGAS